MSGGRPRNGENPCRAGTEGRGRMTARETEGRGWQGTQGAGRKAPPPGWVLDEEGRLRRETIHRMTRRCLNWDYRGRGTYLITMVLNDRSRPVLGRVVGKPPVGGRAQEWEAEFEASELGRRVEEDFLRMGEFAPEIEVLGVQVMTEHLHGVLRVLRRMEKPLGERLRGFKIGASKVARELGVLPPIDGRGQGEAARGKGLFADGFTDTILGDEEAVRKGIAYMRDNPRRLAVKRAFPELFRVVGDLCVPMDGHGQGGHFAAVGNRELLRTPHILQVQVSRRDFAWKRDGKGEIVRSSIDGKAQVGFATAAFEEKAAELLAAGEHGAALVSPCISEGEREIASRAFAAGHKVIALRNKGFSPLAKPGGQLFERCAAGNLLLLAPAGWPYLPGKKPMTRMDVLVLNRLAQLIAGDGAAEIDYKGCTFEGISDLTRKAVTQ